MKITGANKLETQKTISLLEKHGRKTKQKIFVALAKELSKARRQRVAVNLRKLSKLSEKNKKKILVVPGKVLSLGEAIAGIEVAALQFSAEAKKKIEQAKGKALTLNQLAEGKAKPAEMVLVK